MEIRDPIHGNIDLSDTESKIIDTPEMQRLRYIKQLDVSHLIFPGANHTRFEHSLGTMHVTKSLVSQIYENKEREFSYVGLLHDIGHGPFSHLTERFMKTHLKKNHEQMGEKRIKNSEIKDIISDSGMSFSKIMDYFKDADKIDVVGGALGSDRLDYLMRDSHYTGVAYGIIDYERLKSRLVLSNNKVAVLESGISGAESVLMARYFMHLNVYTHHAHSIASKMLQKSIDLALENGVFSIDELVDMYDEQLMGKLLGSNVSRVSDIAKRVKERRLFKRAYYGRVSVGMNSVELEDEIVRAGFGRDEFVVHLVSLAGGGDDIDVVDTKNSLVGKLTERSPLIKALSKMLIDSRRLIVACDKKNIERLENIVKKFVN